jgi:hypothetical protein
VPHPCAFVAQGGDSTVASAKVLAFAFHLAFAFDFAFDFAFALDLAFGYRSGLPLR